MHYDAMKVELIDRIHSIIPEPELNLDWADITKLQWHLGCSIAYLHRHCGPVEIPEIKISTENEFMDTLNKYAVLVNGNGMYVDFATAWRYITDIFEGMRSVYNIKPMDTKFDIPVVFNNHMDHPIGSGTVKRGDHTTELTIRINQPIPVEMFDGMIYICFAYKPGNPATKI